MASALSSALGESRVLRAVYLDGSEGDDYWLSEFRAGDWGGAWVVFKELGTVKQALKRLRSEFKGKDLYLPSLSTVSETLEGLEMGFSVGASSLYRLQAAIRSGWSPGSFGTAIARCLTT